MAFCAAALLFTVPQTAFADYANPTVKTVAQVRTDASMHVVEQRSYRFGDAYSAVTWPFTGITDKQQVTISAVRITQIDEVGTVVKDWLSLAEVPFQTNWRALMQSTEGLSTDFEKARTESENVDHAADKIVFPRANTFAFDSRQNNLYVFLESTYVNTVIECDYVIENAALIYNDTAEIYWDYVSPKEDVQTDNVKVQIQLPVPEAAQIIPGETIVAWGHGPEGSLSINVDGTIDYLVDTVAPGQYAQAHVLFPKEWLNNIPIIEKITNKGMRHDDALREEAAWTDSYSAQRINSFALDIFFLSLCAIVLVVATVLALLYGREEKPGEGEHGGKEPDAAASQGGKESDTEEERGGKASDTATSRGGSINLTQWEPAVIKRLLRWNRSSAQDFAATVEALAQKGVLQIVADATNEHDVRFRLSPDAKKYEKSPLDQETLKIIFDVIGDGYQSVSLSAIEAYCEQNPEEIQQAMRQWQKALDAEVEAAGFFDAKSRKIAKALAVMAVVMALLGVIIWISGSTVSGVAAIITAILIGVMAYMTPKRTALGVEIASAFAMQEDNGEGASDTEGIDWECRLTKALEAAHVS